MKSPKIPRGQKPIEPKVPYEIFGLMRIKNLVNNQREFKDVLNTALERWGKEAQDRIRQNAYIAAVTNDPIFISTGYEPKPFLKQHGLERTYETGVNRLEQANMGSINVLTMQQAFEIRMDKDNPDYAQILDKIKVLLPLMHEEDYTSKTFADYNRGWTHKEGFPLAHGKTFTIWDGNYETAGQNRLIYSDKKWHLIGFDRFTGPKLVKESKDIKVMLKYIQKEHYHRTDWPDKYAGSDY